MAGSSPDGAAECPLICQYNAATLSPISDHARRRGLERASIVKLMYRDLPLVSIVTPTHNAARFLADTIESVLEQDYPNIEYTVIDSWSSDGTQDVLDRYRGRLNSFSVARRGPAFAIHEGLTRARGSILAWLSADDTYEPGAVRAAVESFLARRARRSVAAVPHWSFQAFRLGARLFHLPACRVLSRLGLCRVRA
jgi:glycosyltransferase involved in cell wall biosynthesis